jgi:hypothetical protein
MSEVLTLKFCYLYDKSEETDLTDKIAAYRLFKDPVAYTNDKYPYELLVDGSIGTNATQYSDYDVFWDLVMNLWKSDSFFANGTYRSYGAENVTRDSDYIQFDRKGVTWKIYLTLARLTNEYPLESKYLVYFDPSNSVDTTEM